MVVVLSCFFSMLKKMKIPCGIWSRHTWQAEKNPRTKWIYGNTIKPNGWFSSLHHVWWLPEGFFYQTFTSATRIQQRNIWLVVLTCFNHLEKYESQWEGWNPIYEMENNPFMFQTTNQKHDPQSAKHDLKTSDISSDVFGSLLGCTVPSGKYTKNYGKSPFVMGKSTN